MPLWLGPASLTRLSMPMVAKRARRVSAAARRAVSLRMKPYWAERRKALAKGVKASTHSDFDKNPKIPSQCLVRLEGIEEELRAKSRPGAEGIDPDVRRASE